MKYLIIGALLALVSLLVYRSVRPYLAIVRKVFRITTTLLNQDPVLHKTAAIEKKLSRCVACGTWVPSERAISMGPSIYCSTECLELIPVGKDRKLAG